MMRAANVTRIEANASTHAFERDETMNIKTVSAKALRVARAYTGTEAEFERTLQDRAGTVALAMLLDSFAKDAKEFQKISSARSLDNVPNRHA